MNYYPLLTIKNPHRASGESVFKQHLDKCLIFLGELKSVVYREALINLVPMGVRAQ